MMKGGLSTICGLALLASTAQACEPKPPLRYALSHIPSEVGGADTVRRIELAADGCFWVHYPAWDRRAGDWSMRLNGDELALLETRIAPLASVAFDPATLRASKRQIDDRLKRAPDQRPPLSYVAGASRHQLEIGPGDAQARTLAWTALQHDAERYVELPQLAMLWQAVDALMQLSEDPRLQPLAETAP